MILFAPILALATVRSALLLILSTQTYPAVSASTGTTPPSSSAAASFDPFERERYVQFPTTVFAPTGRLHTVDEVCLGASNCEDVTAGLVVALRCGQKSDDECIVVVATGPRSPLVLQAGRGGMNENARNEDAVDQSDKEEKGDGGNDDASDKYRSPLLLESIRPRDTNRERPLVPSNMSILSPGLVVATGGIPADAAVFLDRIRDVASDIHNSNFGGTGFMYQTSPIGGTLQGRMGIFGADGANLARRVADMIQVPTQSIGTRLGSMLAASALILDAPQTKAGGECRIWRVDPSGQFWSCDAAAVGRGAGVAESFLLKEVARLKRGRNEENDDEEDEPGKDSVVVASLSNQDVKNYLDSLSVKDGIEIARKCVEKVYEKELKHQKSEGEGSHDDEKIPLSINLGGAILRPEQNKVEILEL
mmetsp:Transcript_12456/g.26919  ORF Transcript_12456/g.26919 Transcript_12456/m.26919 type:complete len:421 (-) Transcript_12456:33-1295(-)